MNRKTNPHYGAAQQNMITNFTEAFPDGRPATGVRWQMLAALIVVTAIGLVGCFAIGLALSGLGVK